jgi:putative transposase
MNRGINRREIFHGEQDYQRFIDLVREYKDICGAKVYHWVLMGNHYHLVVEVVYDNLRPFVGGIQQCYAQYHHAAHGDSGVFWSGRYKSKAVEIGPYLGRCARYVERNPTRAGMVVEPWGYRWSSAACYVRGVKDGLTDMNPYFGEFESKDRATYAETLLSSADDELMKRTGKFGVIGSADFANRLELVRGRHKRRRGRPIRSVSISVEPVKS